MLETLLAPKLVVLYVFVASAVYVHHRGRVRHKVYATCVLIPLRERNREYAEPELHRDH